MNTKNKRILLVIPPQIGLLKGFATGIISLATYLEQNQPSIDIDIIDFSLTKLDAEIKIKQFATII